MRKAVILAAVLFAVSALGWAVPCPSGNLTSLGATAPCDISGNVYSAVSSSLSSSLSGMVSITPITSGANAGGFSLSIPLSAFAGLTSGNTFSFTVAAPTGKSITDLSANFVLGTGASGSGDVSFALNNGGKLTAMLGGGAASTTFAGVSSLGITGTVSVAAGAKGTGTLTITPSLTSVTPPSAVPEPASFLLFGSSLLLFGGAGFFIQRKSHRGNA
ncbi:MAG TPA: hypothetical protein VKW70_09635 [Terriglobia bacterium]|nr:hypothetical protein [Terriglobia bacterium]